MLRKLFDILANMGVWIRLNDPRHEPVSETGRAWGVAEHGFVLSLQALHADVLSVLIKNVGETDIAVSVPGWLSYYKVHLVNMSDGQGVTLKAYGARVLQEAASSPAMTRRFAAGKSVATEVPVAVLFDLRPGAYRASVTCTVPGTLSLQLTSNEVTFQAK